jgi:hypothetical protein
MININTNTICANRACAGMLNLVMSAIWLLIPLALMVLSPLAGSRDLRYRDKRGSWRNYQ